MPLEWGAFESARRASFDLASDIDVLLKQVAKHDAEVAVRGRHWLATRPRAAHELVLFKAKLEEWLAQSQGAPQSTPIDTKKEQAS